MYHSHVHARRLPPSLVELLNALDDQLGQLHQALQLGGGALQRGDSPQLVHRLSVRGVALEERSIVHNHVKDMTTNEV